MAKAGALLDEGFMAEMRLVAMKQEREEVYVALYNAANFHCLVEEWKDCEELRPRRERMKRRTEWYAEANRYQCMRCGKGSKYVKMPSRCDGPKFLSKRLGKWRSRHLGGHDLVRRMDMHKVFGIWEAKNWTKANALLQT